MSRIACPGSDGWLLCSGPVGSCAATHGVGVVIRMVARRWAGQSTHGHGGDDREPVRHSVERHGMDQETVMDGTTSTRQFTLTSSARPNLARSEAPAATIARLVVRVAGS